MKVILFGATGMIGQGVLRECLRASDVELVETVGREATGAQHPKVREVVHREMRDFSAIERELTGFDACFFCLGVSSAGMSEADYERVTYGITLAAAETLARLNPGMTFVYVSGLGTNSSEHITQPGRVGWARIKGKTENALMQLRFKGAYMFRPGVIQPLYGVKSKTGWYRMMYTVARPLLTPLRMLFPAYILTTEQIGRAMLAVARQGAARNVLESADIARLSR
jgi:uncharacterized protein YbjT (DUF2867 family)